MHENRACWLAVVCPGGRAAAATAAAPSGQVQAMLSGTAVAPPQLDEFLMPSQPHLRAAEMAALGWDEAAVYGSGRPPA